MSAFGLIAMLTMTLNAPILASQKQQSACEFGNRALEGRLVTFHGLLTFGSHGGVVQSDACPKESDPAAILFPGTYRSPKVNFQLDPGLLDKLGPFFRVNFKEPPLGIACATLTGQIFSKRGFKRREFGGGWQGNGYGSRGVARFGFVIQSVTDIRPCYLRDSGK